MISVNADEFKKELEVAAENIKKRLERMVVEFAESIGTKASANTPVVDQQNIQPDGKFYKLYELRKEDWNIDIEQGFHAGSWRYSEGDFSLDSNIYAEEEVSGKIRADARSRYQLGDTFYISGTGPAMRFLENGGSFQAPNGIVQPTLDELEAVYQQDFTESFNRKL